MRHIFPAFLITLCMQTLARRMRANLRLALGLCLLAAQPLPAVPAGAQPADLIVAQFPIPGSEPRGLTWDGNHLWLVDKAGTVYQLTLQGQVLSTFSLTFMPRGLAWDGSALWVGDETNRRYARVSPTGVILGTLDLWYWSNSGLAWDGQQLWLGNYNTRELHQHDTTGARLRSWTVPLSSGVEHPTGLAFDGTNLWVGDSNEGSENAVAWVNPSGQVLLALDTRDWGLPPVRWPEYKTLAWDGSHLWYSADDLTHIYRLDVQRYLATTPLSEAVDNPALAWTTGGSPGWFGQTHVHYAGGAAARSGAPDSGQQSWLQTAVTGPALVAFRWRCAGCAGSSLRFMLDGAHRSYCWYDAEWEQQVYALPAGAHTLTWTYAPAIQQPGDAGYLDEVMLRPGPALWLRAPTAGQGLPRRDLAMIRWLATADAGPTVRLELRQGAAPVYAIAAATENDGQEAWLIPMSVAPGTEYRVRVSTADGAGVYDEGGAFTITEAAQSTLRGALLLPTAAAYAQAADEPELDVGTTAAQGLTVEAWVSFASFGDTDIADKSAYRLYTRARYQAPYAYRCLGAAVRLAGGTEEAVEACQASSSGQGFWRAGWHHTALVVDRAAGQLRLYLDGEQIAATPLTGALSDAAASLRIGPAAASAMDEVRVSSVARYTAATYPLPDAPLACDPDTRALWHLDEPVGATVFRDACGAVDNRLAGFGGARTEGLASHNTYLPLTSQ